MRVDPKNANTMAGDPPGGDAAAPGAAREPLREVPRVIVACLFIGLAARQAAFVHRHAINVLYWDQWDFFQPLFNHQGLWETFDRQHGPHREGLGLVLTRALAYASGWNSRWDAFAVCALMVGAALMCLILAARFGIGGRSILLAAVPLLFMNTHQYEIYVGAVNLSYAGVPLALFMAFCLSWFARSQAWRLASVAVLTFLLIFTGFGLFVGVLTPFLLALEALQAWRARERRHSLRAALALLFVCAAWGIFLHGYTFQPAVEGFRFPYERPVEYVVFIARMLGHFFGTALLSAGELAFGLCVAGALVAISAWNGIRCALRGVEREPRSVVLFCLASFALLFCINCSVGRAFTGPIAPYSSRYVALLIPGGVAILLQAAELSGRRLIFWLALAFTAFLVPATAFPRPYEVWGANWYTEGRRAWKAEYLRTHDEAGADKAAHFPIYPGRLGERLRYLEEHGLNLYLPSPDPEPPAAAPR